MFQKVKADFASRSWCPQTKDLDKSQPLLSASVRQKHTLQLRLVTACNTVISNVTLTF